MSKKRAIYSNAENELTTGSAFFPGYLKPGGAAHTPPSPDPAPGAEPQSTAVPPKDTTAASATLSTRPERRVMVRHSFEVYIDQVESLRACADIQRRRGDPGSMSRIVRKAIDSYLESHPLDEI